MALTTEQREKAWNRFRKWIEETGEVTFNKNELRTAFDESILWTEKNQVRNSYNSDLSEPVKSSATVQQKMVILAMALLIEAGVII